MATVGIAAGSGMLRPLLRGIVVLGLAGMLAGCGAWRARIATWFAPAAAPSAAPVTAATPAAAEPALSADQQRELDRRWGLGAEALGRNDLDAAIAAWRGWLALAPPGLARARTLRGHLTLLEREAAKRFARQAAAGERAALPAAADRLQVAVFPFRDDGPTAAASPFHRAVVAMVMADLAKVPSLTLLERERIDALLGELKLSASGLVDPAAMAAPGRLLGAGSVVAGTVRNAPGTAGPGSGRYAIVAAVTGVADGRVAGTAEADGAQADFFVLEKRVVHGILAALGVPASEIPPAVARHHTTNWQAYARFAAGLNALAADRFDEARAAFRAALAFDAGFALADEALAATPAKAATFDEVRGELLR